MKKLYCHVLPVAGVSPLRSGFDSSCHVGFVVDKVALRKVSSGYPFSPSNFHSTNLLFVDRRDVVSMLTVVKQGNRGRKEELLFEKLTRQSFFFSKRLSSFRTIHGGQKQKISNPEYTIP
jgi:hypothetical protein